MTGSELVARARTALKQGTTYRSPGRVPPLDLAHWPVGAATDCSGFVSWCLRWPKGRVVTHPLYERVNGGWFETTAIHADGLSPVGYFRQLAAGVPGALLVYPDVVDTSGKLRQGHMGVVAAASGAGLTGVTEVIHCSVSNGRKGDAIAWTGADVWVRRKDAIIVWYEGLEG